MTARPRATQPTWIDFDTNVRYQKPIPTTVRTQTRP